MLTGLISPTAPFTMAASFVPSSLLAKPITYQGFFLAAHFSCSRPPKRLFHDETRRPASITEQSPEASRIHGHATSSGHPFCDPGKFSREPILAREKAKQGRIGLSGFRQSSGPTASFSRFFFDRDPEQLVRVRFAPSPTGYLHLGSLRTALFNVLAARASEGAFILRIEDTDQNRLVPDAEARLMQDLKWAGLEWDEGPDRGGQFGPYRQSERLHIYQKHVQWLIDKGFAYRCFCSHNQLEDEKLRLKEAGMPVVYSGVCRDISPSDSQRHAALGKPYAVRFRGDLVGASRFRDAVYGFFENHQPEDDYIILKRDGFPTYHLANVIDDHLMRITNVIRGDVRLDLPHPVSLVEAQRSRPQEWLISTPKHLALYKAFGWEPPTFAHLGLLVGPGKTKLSKRNHDSQVAEYQKRGIFPMALLCWLANFGSSLRGDAGVDNKVPRTVTELSKKLSFKFTRGSIQVNYELLDRWQVKYRNALLTEHVPRLADMEFQLIHLYLVKPTLRDIATVNNPDNDFKQGLPVEWQHDLQPVPALEVDKTKAEYVARVFWAAGHQMMPFLTVRLFVQKHPYLFWRVPAAIYESSVRDSPPNHKLLDLVDQAIEQEHLWDKNGDQVVKAIRTAAQGNHEPCPTEQKPVPDELELEIHNTVRLIAIGVVRGVSLNTTMLFAMLGRDEWRHRLDSLYAALKKVQSSSGPTPFPVDAT